MSPLEAKVTSKGQITLPSKLRKRLNVGPGDHVVFVEETRGRIVIKARSGTLASMRGMLKGKVRAPSQRQLEGWLDEARSRALQARGKSR
jgi:AbrB family looped-hinge helix DNA binding protein